MFLNTSHYIKELAFSQSFCDNIIKVGQSKKLEKAKITSGNQSNRNSKISFIKDANIETKITRVINEANENCGWNFLLREYEPLQYTVYNEGDFYDWHIDSRSKPHDNGLIRKMSFTICLNDDYDGGLFELCSPHPINEKKTITSYFLKKGSIIIFPSHIWHKVHEITSGVRKTLVGWIVGKPFV